MLSQKEISQLKDALEHCKRPIYFFHDDPDGLASFLLLYRKIREGKGYCVKAFPHITADFARKVEEYGADSVFVLDIAMVDQEFIDGIKVPVYWIDHHTPVQRENVKYFNPRKTGKNTPASVLCWQVVEKEQPSDLWIAITGAIGDWFMPDQAKELQEKMPEFLPPEIKDAQEALFNSPLGRMVKIFSFNLKGPTSEVNKSIRIMTRIEHPDEILKQTTPRGRLIFKKYASINKVYERMLKKISGKRTRGGILVHTYSHDKLSLTKDLANELLYKFRDKVIVLGRIKSGEIRCSLRAPAGIQLDKALEKALIGVQGYGGGHEQACGAGIKQEDFERFIENLKRELSF
ncbi:MAG: DHH family phosphoesterase [Candidatus Woesearchaeota archaeon]